MILSLLALVPGASATDVLPIEPRSVVAASRREVACAQVGLGPFVEREGDLSVDLPQPGGPVRVLLIPRSLEDPDSRDVLWVDVDRDGEEGDGEVVIADRRDARAPFVFVSLEAAGLPLELMLYEEEGSVRATAMTHYHHEVDVEIEGETWRVVFLDMDLDRAVSAGDEWLALDARQSGIVRLTSILFSSHLATEPCYIAPNRVVRLKLGERPSLEVAAAEIERHEFLARRASKNDREVFERFDRTREEFLRAHGVVPDREVDPDPPRWYHAQDLDEAMAVAQERGRPLWVEFGSDGCPWCKRYAWLNHRDAEVTAILREFTLVKICRDLDSGATADGLGLEGVPSHALFGPDGEARYTSSGWVRPAAHVDRLMDARAQYARRADSDR